MKAAKSLSSATTPSFAVAFGGGGARGLAHIHVIEALDELGIKPVAIAGSSIGAIMGAGMASGMAGAEIHAHAKEILSRRAEVASRMWRARPGSLTEFFAGGFSFGQFNVERLLRAFLPHQIPDTFEELVIPLQVTATDYFGHCLHICDSGDLISALGASAAIPAVFKPVVRDDRLLIDGGIYNPVPFDLVLGKADITIGIDVVGAPSTGRRKVPTTIDLMFGSSQLMMQSIIANKLQQMRPDILLHPPVSRFRVLDFLKMDAVMAETVSIKDDLKRAVEAALVARKAA
ncbi:MAG: patatin-like phospholipase family protein [Rhizobiaceae bacterium]|nr:patatin-like phospholipase family protein [Rhizobiaceae bacterium]